MSASFQWFPVLPVFYYILLAAAAALIVAIALYRRAFDFVWRAGFFLLLIFLLLNPVILNEEREALPDKLLIVVDESTSQKIAGRDKVAEEALAAVQSKLEGVEPVILRMQSSATMGRGESTNLFSGLRDSIASIPAGQVAGTVLITDGQVHDVPKEAGVLARLAPFHVILTGKNDEFDHKVTVVSAPKYGVLDEEISLMVRADVFGGDQSQPLTLVAFQDGQKQDETQVMPGEMREFKFKLRHPGQNVFEFSVPAREGELTAHNNTAPVIVNAIRDRLRVLLVSGAPHMGERAWRNLLKADPSIDLVHFTILRSPSSTDATPQRELSLIVFPVDELFERKIQDFDLIIFDRYYQYGLLMPQYFTNISDFVKKGGALLLANSTDENDSAVFSTAIAELLPVAQREASTIVRQPYMPKLTEEGKKHPATSELARRYAGRKWGQWHSQSDFSARRGEVLMTGVDGKPLLVIDKVEEGRVAVLASDDIWMWSKGGKQAGPYTEMLRSVSHWLMKEPELEEDFIKAEANGRSLTVSQRETAGLPKTVTMKKPSGASSDVALNIRDGGWVRAELAADETGVYSFTSGARKTFVVVGTADNPEFADVHTTEEKLKPLVDSSHGGMVWFQENRDFTLRRVSANARRLGDDDWIGLRRNEAYSVTNVSSSALVPGALVLFLILGGAILMWRREGGSE